MDSLAAGTIIHDRFELERFLGEGGMGVVWSARHQVTGKRVALKLLKTPTAEQRSRFLREARVAAALRHPNLVDVHDVLELPDGRPLLVMDLLEGEPLSDHLQREGALPLEACADILLPVLAAVGAAHAAGVVHRDLKPDNIFLLAQRSPTSLKVLDFGIAKLTSELGVIRHTAALTQTGSVLGTPTYMAPEQVFGERTIDYRADIWSLGVIAYECLSGSCPIEGENVGQIFKSIAQRCFKSLGQSQPSLPRDIVSIVDRMLSSKAAERPSLEEVAVAFGRYATVPIPEIPPPLSRAVTRADGHSAHHTPASYETTVAAKPPAFDRRRLILAGAILVATAGVVTLLILRPRSAPLSVDPPGSLAAPTTLPTSPLTLTVTADSSVASAASGEPAPRATAAPRPSDEAPRPPQRTGRGASSVASEGAPAPSPVPTTLPGGVHAPSPY